MTPTRTDGAGIANIVSLPPRGIAATSAIARTATNGSGARLAVAASFTR
jgi:hypothetical protein